MNLNHLIEPSSQGVNRLFVLGFEDDAQRISRERYSECKNKRLLCCDLW